MRLRQVAAGRTHLTYRRVVVVPLKFKGPRLRGEKEKRESPRTERAPVLSFKGFLSGDVLPDDVSPLATSRKDSSAGARDYRPEIIDNPARVRVTEREKKEMVEF